MAKVTNTLGAIAVAFLLAGCGGESETAAEEPAAEEPTTEESAADESGCEAVPKALVKAIQEGLTIQGGGKLRSAQAVKSNDYESVYYVSADIQGSGLEGPNDIGTWATNSLTAGEGLILAADSVAKEFSTWGADVGPDSEVGQTMSMDNDGAEESRACVAG